MRHAFIADGRLYVHHPEHGLREIESQFASDKAARAERHQERNAWKSAPSADNPYFGRGLVWGGQAQPMQSKPFRFLSVICADPDTLFYVLSNGSAAGLFRYHMADPREVRLWTGLRPPLLGMDWSPHSNQIVASTPQDNGGADLQILDSEGRVRQTVTGGDSRDLHPWFSRCNPRAIYYQSAGISRTEQGVIASFGPESILRVDLETGELKEVLAGGDVEYLLPKDDRDGNLYCIRRPWRAPGSSTLGQSLLGCLTFPFRLVGAIFNFLTAFTRLFSDRPMRAAGPDVRPPEEPRTVQVLGRTIDLAKVQKAAKGDEDLSLVPDAWELIRVSPDGRIETVATQVSWFDVAPDGTVVTTNGYRVRSGSATVLKHKLIQSVRWVGPAAPAPGGTAAAPPPA